MINVNKLTYNSEIVLDSVSSQGNRITTFELTIPKWLVAELNTHRSNPGVTRMLCRNSASSRAIPTNVILSQVKTNPVIPLDWRARNTGMTSDVFVDQLQAEMEEGYWLEARDKVVAIVEAMMAVGDGVDKQRINRLLEPWMWTIVVVTATEWDNFFTLRDSEYAQPEFAHIAHMMQQQYIGCSPKYRVMHLPYVDNDRHMVDAQTDKYNDLVVPDGLHKYNYLDALVSAARVGRVSYFRQGEHSEKFTVDEDITRGLSFARKKHWSPFEAPSLAAESKFYGPLFGWKPLRKFFPEENGRLRLNESFI